MYLDISSIDFVFVSNVSMLIAIGAGLPIMYET
jgi:hypothetical protein